MEDNWDTDTITFNPTIIDESKRIIEGVATAPIYDRTNELITSDAIKKALPDYMVLPVLTVQHTEFVAGLVRKAWFDESDKLHIKAQLKNTRDVDRIWDLIKSGDLNAFSISGTRNKSTCSINHDSLNQNPCITSDICLNAITICGNNKANQEAFFDVVNKTKGNLPMTDEVKEQTTPVEQPQIDQVSLAKALVAELKESGLLNISKACEEDDKKEEEKKDDDEVKKSIDAHTESIESLKKTVEELTEKFNTLSKAVERIDNEPMQKTAYKIEGTTVVPVNDMQKTVSAEDKYRSAFIKMRME